MPTRVRRPAAAALTGLLLVAAEARAQPAPGHAALPPRLDAPFGAHMVLQRQLPLQLWGRGTPGRTLRVTLAGLERLTEIGADGRWHVQLPALPAGGPHELHLHDGHAASHVDGVMVGDVWLCAGQSNMAWPLSMSAGGDGAIASAAQGTVRHLRVPTLASVRPADEIPAADWQVASPGTAGGFSAVGWHFARHLQARQGVPIGLINIAWNGSNLETWVRRGAALADPVLSGAVHALPADDATLAAARALDVQAQVRRFQGDAPAVSRTPDGPADDATLADPGLDDLGWPTLVAPQPWEAQGLTGLDGVVWYRHSVELSAAQARGDAVLHLAKIDDWDDTWVNGERVGATRHHDTPRRYGLRPGLLREGRNVIAVRVTDLGQGGGLHGSASMLRLDTAAGSVPLAGRWRARVVRIAVPLAPEANHAPSLAHNAMVAPLAGLPLRGVLWYQGESNVVRADRYAATFGRLIDDWRAHFAQPQLPFLFVQLAPFGPPTSDLSGPSGWALLREAQADVLARPATGMVVTTDLGDADGDLHPKNKRDVGERLAALALALDASDRVAVHGPRLRQVQRHGSELVATFDTRGLGLAVRPAGAPLQGFALAGADGRFHAADARLDGDRVRVGHAQVPAPAALRYGWADNPSQANLVDGSGLPAAPWRHALPAVASQERP